MAGKATLSEVKGGVASFCDLLKINAILDAEQAAEAAQAEKYK